MTTRGKLYVFEGPDGVGKSTLAQWFASHLQESGIRCTLLSFPGKEAGTLGQHVYGLHHDPARFGISALSAASLQLLHVAAHIDAIETRIKPLLHQGETVVLDRFWWSTFVYGLVGGVSRSVLDSMVALERTVWHPVQPDRFFLITREAPLRPEPPELWPRWRDAYVNLAGEERHNHPVLVVENNRDMAESKNRIIETL
jgi:thymidylate kinase